MEEVTTLLVPAGALVVGRAAGVAVEEVEGPTTGGCITGGYMEIVGRTG